MHIQLARTCLAYTILAAIVLQACAQDAAAPTVAPTQLRCIGICGDDEGELEAPDLVVSYQWNSRVPVCAGLSCDTASCAALEEKLGLLEVTEFECTRHRLDMQDTAGCTCSKPKKRPPVREETLPQKGTPEYYSQNHYYWLILIIVPVLYLLVWIGCWLGKRRDDKIATEQGEEAEGAEP